MNSLSIVILAAGQGKRMCSDLPKVLHTLAGRSLLSHVVTTARSLQPQQLVVVYGHGGEQVQQAFGTETDIQWAHQAQQLGTGHALQQALPFLPSDGTTLVLYGDVPLTSATTLQQLLATAGDQVGLLTDHLAQPQGYGRIVRDTAGQICAIVEEKDATPEQKTITEINTGILALPNRYLAGWLSRLSNSNAQGEYYLTDVIALAVADGVAVHGCVVPSSWQAAGVNSKLQLAELERIYQRQQANLLLEAGVQLADPNRFDLRGELRCGKDVFIDINVVIEGVVELGDGVTIGPNCVLRDVTIAAGTEVAAFSHLQQAQVGASCRLGPYARLRPGAELADQVHIGNFVEVKKSHIAQGSKVNHLSYIGDAVIGAGVNVGAGTITCNYDGVNKFTTRIADGAFIGSGTMLVAPVVVEENATIGAGSVISKTAPANALTVARSKAITLSNWKRPQKIKDVK